MTSRIQRAATSMLVGALIATAPLAASVAHASPTARPSANCNINGKQRDSGPTYLTSLSVSGTGCATGLRVVRAYYACRVASGGVKGYCHKPVLGFRCSERRQGISIQFDSSVTCVKGQARVLHTYTQDT
jgi:hypothetical protein